MRPAGGGLVVCRSGYDSPGMAGTSSEAMEGPVAALLDRGEQLGCIALSEVDELVQALELDDDGLGHVYEQSTEWHRRRPAI